MPKLSYHHRRKTGKVCVVFYHDVFSVLCVCVCALVHTPLGELSPMEARKTQQ